MTHDEAMDKATTVSYPALVRELAWHGFESKVELEDCADRSRAPNGEYYAYKILRWLGYW